MAGHLRLAEDDDIPLLRALITRSGLGLSEPFYTRAQAEAVTHHVFGVDSQLVTDRTYFLIEHQIVARMPPLPQSSFPKMQHRSQRYRLAQLKAGVAPHEAATQRTIRLLIKRVTRSRLPASSTIGSAQTTAKRKGVLLSGEMTT